MCAQRGSTVGKDSVIEGADATMRSILACHQGIYTERQMPNGVGGDVCATGGPDLRLGQDVTFWWVGLRGEGERGRGRRGGLGSSQGA